MMSGIHLFAVLVCVDKILKLTDAKWQTKSLHLINNSTTNTVLVLWHNLVLFQELGLAVEVALNVSAASQHRQTGPCVDTEIGTCRILQA